MALLDHAVINNTIYKFAAEQVNGHTVGSDVPASAVFDRYATCSTGASTTNKAVTLSGFTLTAGAKVNVKFTYSNTASAPKLNVNSTGAIAIRKYGTTAAGTTENASWKAGEVVPFLYDGSYWYIIGKDPIAGLTEEPLSLTENQQKIAQDNIGMHYGNAGYHNSIYRGKYLGSSYTSAQKSAISAGTFDDLFIGDYWTISSVNWRIAAFDYWYNGQNVTAHHVAVVPDTTLTSGTMNSTESTSTGYGQCTFRTASSGVKSTMKTTVNNAFGSSYILAVARDFSSAASDGTPTAKANYSDTAVECMTESMIFGHQVYSSKGVAQNAYQEGFDLLQLPLFRLNRSLIACGNPYWLQNIVSDKSFCNVTADGVLAAKYANNSTCYFRPIVAVKG